MGHPLRSAALALIAAACIIVVGLATTIAEPLPPLSIDPFWLAFVGLPVVGSSNRTIRAAEAAGPASA